VNSVLLRTWKPTKTCWATLTWNMNCA